jgi:hypothetical protein
MNSKKNTYQQIIEFNKKTFLEKVKKRKQNAKLPFEEKLKIVGELNALIMDFKERRTGKKGILVEDSPKIPRPGHKKT